mmetsp:Transcript_38319/g.69421  ORF Transcript_38319/g.69421 Transcript_38319/m.69421 type:complete len:135 (+) Transcript_38319:2490-2894(+)
MQAGSDIAAPLHRTLWNLRWLAQQRAVENLLRCGAPVHECQRQVSVFAFESSPCWGKLLLAVWEDLWGLQLVWARQCLLPKAARERSCRVQRGAVPDLRRFSVRGSCGRGGGEAPGPKLPGTVRERSRELRVVW